MYAIRIRMTGVYVEHKYYELVNNLFGNDSGA